MKPSHLTTPRTLAECTFVQGYRTHYLNDRPSVGEFIVQAFIGLALMGCVAALVFGWV